MVDDEVELAIEGELTLLTPQVRRSVDQLEDLLDPDFSEIGASGRLWKRDEMIAALIAHSTADQLRIKVSEMSGRRVGPNLVLLTYVTDFERRRARRSSLWRRSGEGWRVLHHQGTPLP